MILLDSGYLVALVNRRDQLHSRAVAWSKESREKLLVSEFVLLEAFDALSHPRIRSAAHSLYDQLMRSTQSFIVPCDSALVRRGLELHRSRPDKAWSLTDCISFTLMKDHVLTKALAYDIHFEQAGFEPLLRRDP